MKKITETIVLIIFCIVLALISFNPFGYSQGVSISSQKATPFYIESIYYPLDNIQIDEQFEKHRIHFDKLNQKNLKAEFFQDYYMSVFYTPLDSLVDACLSGEAKYLTEFNRKSCYFGHGNPYEANDIEKVKGNISNLKREVPINRFAVTVVDRTHVRVYPTEEPCLSDPSKAGEGLEFDYFTQTHLKPHTPIRILYESIDKAWVLAVTPECFGWIKKTDIGLMNTEQVDLFKIHTSYYVFTDDYQVVSSSKQKHRVFKPAAGTILPAVDNNTLLFPLSGTSGELIYDTLLVNKDVHEFPLKFTSSNIKLVLSNLSGTKYGWGDAGPSNRYRDCSGLMRDYFRIFGLHLPRNSSQQRIVGDSLDVSTLNNQDKITQIKNRIPFVSLVYRKGHIALYIGIDNYDTPLIFHCLWAEKYESKNRREYKAFIKAKKAGATGITIDKKNKKAYTRNPIHGKTCITKTDIIGTEKIISINTVK